MIGAIIEIVFGLAIWKLFPSLIHTAKKKKKKVAFWCNVIGAVVVILGGIHFFTSLFHF